MSPCAHMWHHTRNARLLNGEDLPRGFSLLGKSTTPATSVGDVPLPRRPANLGPHAGGEGSWIRCLHGDCDCEAGSFLFPYPPWLCGMTALMDLAFPGLYTRANRTPLKIDPSARFF